MISTASLPPLPAPDIDRLTAIDLALPILAFLAVSGHGSSARGAIEKTLAPVYGDAGAVGAALADLGRARVVSLTKGGRCRITDTGRAKAEERLGRMLGRNWPDMRDRALAALALGLDPKSEAVRSYLGRKDGLECAALARLYGLSGLEALPDRSQLRLALLSAMIMARLPECEAAFTEITMHNPSRDAIGMAVMLGAAGLKTGTARDAETALLRKALGIRPDAGGGAVAEALIRGGIAKAGARSQARPKVEIRVGEDKPDLAAFAADVRDLAKTLRTDPFAGRVAIAQVYDAGIMRGLAFGTLDAFKLRVAEAGRAGLLDLERYDVAGPMDQALRDRSRIAFGRDERHFIVNEWI
jgi:hypothetical protein